MAFSLFDLPVITNNLIKTLSADGIYIPSAFILQKNQHTHLTTGMPFFYLLLI